MVEEGGGREEVVGERGGRKKVMGVKWWWGRAGREEW